MMSLCGCDFQSACPRKNDEDSLHSANEDYAPEDHFRSRRPAKISGTVVDVHGALVPGARLTLSNPDTPNETRKTETTSEGSFEFDSLPAENIRLRSRPPASRRLEIEKVVVEKSELLNLDLILELDYPPNRRRGSGGPSCLTLPSGTQLSLCEQIRRSSASEII